MHGAPVLSGDESIFSSITPVGLRDGEAVQLPDGNIAEPFLHREQDLHAVPEPTSFNVVLIDLKLEGCSVFLKNLKEARGGLDYSRNIVVSGVKL